MHVNHIVMIRKPPEMFLKLPIHGTNIGRPDDITQDLYSADSSLSASQCLKRDGTDTIKYVLEGPAYEFIIQKRRGRDIANHRDFWKTPIEGVCRKYFCSMSQAANRIPRLIGIFVTVPGRAVANSLKL